MTMPEQSPASTTNSGRSAWVLAAPGAGDNHQLRSLGKLLASELRWIEHYDGVSRVLIDRLKPGAKNSIPQSKQSLFAPPWPDLVLIAGGRSVIDALRIRTASHGKSRVICIGRPWAPLHWFDLVLSTPQYQLPESKSLLTLPLPLNLPDKAECPAAEPNWGALLRPWNGVLLGGNSGSYRFTQKAVLRIADQLNTQIESNQGSAIIVSSPRTPDRMLDTLESQLNVPCTIHRWQPPPAPSALPAILHHTDSLYVTSDSASMLAEAIYSLKPVTLLELALRPRSWLLRMIRERRLPGRTIKNRLVEGGLWLPARDLSLLHDRLIEQGLLSNADDSGKADANSAQQTINEMVDTVRQRVDRLFD